MSPANIRAYLAQFVDSEGAHYSVSGGWPSDAEGAHPSGGAPPQSPGGGGR